MYLPAPKKFEYQSAPSGSHRAICYRVVDLGTQQGEYEGKPKKSRKIKIFWELSDELMDTPNNPETHGKPFTISKKYSFTMNERSVFKKDLEAWRGKPFEDKDFGPNGFNIQKLLGAPCMLGISHLLKKDGSGTYAAISNVMKLLKGSQAPELVNPTLYFSLEPEFFNKEVFESLPEFLRSEIMKSPEYHELFRNQPVPAFNNTMPDDDIGF